MNSLDPSPVRKSTCPGLPGQYFFQALLVSCACILLAAAWGKTSEFLTHDTHEPHKNSNYSVVQTLTGMIAKYEHYFILL